MSLLRGSDRRASCQLAISVFVVDAGRMTAERLLSEQEEVMSIPKCERRYLDYEMDIKPAEKSTLMANWSRCPSCHCRVFPVTMRAFEYRGDVFFEGTCPQCGKIMICVYDKIID
jgi:RNase P subunit RPR2